MPNPPNIILIQSDSMDGRMMGCMGHPALAAATPNCDQLSRDGTMFRQAYCNSPICCPSRASMWSGLHTHHCKAWNNYKGLEPQTPTFLEALEQAGYETGVIGRTDHFAGKHSSRARVTAWTRAARIMRPAYRMPPPLVEDSDLERYHSKDWQYADAAAAWLGERAGSDQPFFLSFGTGSPHPPFRTSRRWLDLIPEAAVDLPGPDQQSHSVMEYHRQVLNWEHGLDADTVRLCRRIYFAMIAEWDATLAPVLQALDTTGLADNTFVIVTSDHGELAFEHNTFYKMCAYEPAVRVPLLLRGPGVQKGVALDNLVSLVDIYPTLLDMAGRPIPERGLDGTSLLPLAAGEPQDRPDWVLTQYHDTTCDTGVFMIRRGDWKYISYPGYAPQLFNLATDPGELNNRADAEPVLASQMDKLLHTAVDVESVDAEVKAYDRAAFRQWRSAAQVAGIYGNEMARIFGGFDRVAADGTPQQAWTAADEAQLERWLAQ